MSDLGLGIIVAGGINSMYGTASRTARSIGPIVANVTLEERHEDRIELTRHPVSRGASITDHAYAQPQELTLRVGWTNSTGAGAGTISGDVGTALLNKLAGSAQNAVSGAAQQAIGGSALGNLGAAALSGQQPIGGSSVGLGYAQLSELLAEGATSFGFSVNTGTGVGTSRIDDIYDSLRKLQASLVPFDVYTGKRKYSDMLITALVVETAIETENMLIATVSCRQVIIVQTVVTAVGADPSAQLDAAITSPVRDAGLVQVTNLAPGAAGGALARAVQMFVPAYLQ